VICVYGYIRESDIEDEENLNAATISPADHPKDIASKAQVLSGPLPKNLVEIRLQAWTEGEILEWSIESIARSSVLHLILIEVESISTFDSIFAPEFAQDAGLQLFAPDKGGKYEVFHEASADSNHRLLLARRHAISEPRILHPKKRDPPQRYQPPISSLAWTAAAPFCATSASLPLPPNPATVARRNTQHRNVLKAGMSDPSPRTSGLSV
jgi:hypothetical protein